VITPAQIIDSLTFRLWVAVTTPSTTESLLESHLILASISREPNFLSFGFEITRQARNKSPATQIQNHKTSNSFRSI